MRRKKYMAAALLGAGLLAGLTYTLAQNGALTKAPAPDTARLTASRIVKVVAYPNSALVTREVDVPAGTGMVELIVSPLPVRVIHNTLYSEGSPGIRILSTRSRTRPVFEDTREEVRKLEDSKKKLELAAEKIKADLNAVSMNMKTLDGLEKFT